MTMLTELRTKLLADGAIAAVVVDRIHPDAWPQGSPLPAVVIGIVSTVTLDNLAGASGLEQSRVQIDCLALTRLAADALEKLIQTRLETDHRGFWGSVWIHGLEIASGLRHDRWPPNAGSDAWRYLASLDVIITYRV